MLECINIVYNIILYTFVHSFHYNLNFKMGLILKDSVLVGLQEPGYQDWEIPAVTIYVQSLVAMETVLVTVTQFRTKMLTEA